jgi:hypothetical protein
MTDLPPLKYIEYIGTDVVSGPEEYVFCAIKEPGTNLRLGGLKARDTSPLASRMEF